jgi:hypothetical protein
MNNLKQIMLGVHHFAAVHNDRLPDAKGDSGSPNPGISVLPAILDYVEWTFVASQYQGPNPQVFLVKTYLSPADPTVPDAIAHGADVASYAANAEVFRKGSRYPSTFRDGTSNTIAVAEHYAYDCRGVMFNPLLTQTGLYGFHRSTFADDLSVDAIPVTTPGNPPITNADLPGLTFQVAPTRIECSPSIAQTPHPAGMLVALADGSVRILSPRMAPTTYWAAVTPAKGEILGPDW